MWRNLIFVSLCFIFQAFVTNQVNLLHYESLSSPLLSIIQDQTRGLKIKGTHKNQTNTFRKHPLTVNCNKKKAAKTIQLWWKKRHVCSKHSTSGEAMFQRLSNLLFGEVEEVAAELKGPNPCLTEADEEGWMLVNLPGE